MTLVQVNEAIFRRSRAANSIVLSLIRPKFYLIADVLHVITCKFKKDRTNCNREKVEASIFRRSMAANAIIKSPTWPKFELIHAFMPVRVTGKYLKD